MSSLQFSGMTADEAIDLRSIRVENGLPPQYSKIDSLILMAFTKIHTLVLLVIWWCCRSASLEDDALGNEVSNSCTNGLLPYEIMTTWTYNEGSMNYIFGFQIMLKLIMNNFNP